jgi:hypothetical protein
MESLKGVNQVVELAKLSRIQVLKSYLEPKIWVALSIEDQYYFSAVGSIHFKVAHLFFYKADGFGDRLFCAQARNTKISPF